MQPIRFLIDEARDALKLGTFFPARHVWGAAGRRSFTTRVRGAGVLEMRCGSTDADVVRQVFGDREYDFSGTHQYRALMSLHDRLAAAGQIPLVLDIGGNIGASAIWFARAFPRARVVAIEPDPDNAAMCRRNTAGFDAITTVEAAIGGAPGSVTLSHRAHAWAVRTVRDGGGTVPIRTIGELVSAQGPDARLFMVKIDIEGFESDLFDGDVAWLSEAQAVLIEPHDWLLPGKHTSRSFQRAMARHDFEMLICGENLVYVAAALLDAPQQKDEAQKTEANENTEELLLSVP